MSFHQNKSFSFQFSTNVFSTLIFLSPCLLRSPTLPLFRVCDQLQNYSNFGLLLCMQPIRTEKETWHA